MNKHNYFTADVEDIENGVTLFYKKKKVTAEIISLPQTRYNEKTCSMTDIHYDTEIDFTPGLVLLNNNIELEIDNFESIEGLEIRT